MSVCEHVDDNFEQQFSTYSTMRKIYWEEYHLRYVNFIIRHNLLDQFVKEDNAANE